MNSSLIARQFNRSSAGSYDQHAGVQRRMAMQLAEVLQVSGEDAPPASVLDIGCGTGALTSRLAAAWPQAEITALDVAPGMLLAAQKRLQFAGPAGVRFLHADVEQWSAHSEGAAFDLIVSSACFQWLKDPKTTLQHLRRLLRSGGRLLFTTFGPDTFYELHQSFEDVYRSFGLQPQRHGLTFRSGTDWSKLLAEAGFAYVETHRALHPITHPSPRDFLHAVKKLGASASEAAAAPGLSKRRLFAEMYQAYANKFSTPEGIRATYELLLLQAKSAD